MLRTVDSVHHVDLDVPANLNDLLGKIEQLQLPTTVFLHGNAFLLETNAERRMLLLGMQTMWNILDDRRST